MKWFKEGFLLLPINFTEKGQKIIIDIGSYCVDGNQTYRQYFDEDQFECYSTVGWSFIVDKTEASRLREDFFRVEK